MNPPATALLVSAAGNQGSPRGLCLRSIRTMRFRALAIWLLLAVPALARSAENGMAASPSAFVRAQADRAMHWHAWNDATLAEARAANKSVYVFIGSPLSELTRATINQTLANAKTVAWLNENFFCIFVDADTQPEVAAYAQNFINTVKQLGGWPVHLWLTPELQPYDGANYLPPSEEWGKPGFLKTARSALEAWTLDPARARALAAEAMAMMRPPVLGDGPKIDLKARLDSAAVAWLATVDPKYGGFGDLPKQPEPELIRYHLARDPAARTAALNAARVLVTSAVRDPGDGGFYRRASDEEGREPYRQKTLVDQARIALALLDAAAAAKDDQLRAAAYGALDFALKELRNPDGTFAAALDGTLDENADQAQRPNFVRVGTATSGAHGLFIAALQQTGEKRFTAMATQLAGKLRQEFAGPGQTLAHIAGFPTAATATDYAAVALAFRSLGEYALADRLVARANGLFFDAAPGLYLASTAKLPAGIAIRAPTLRESPSAEVLALFAAVDGKSAILIRRGLLASIQYDELPPGDVLLALATAH